MPTLTLAHTEPAGTGLRLLTFREPLPAFVHPGQFVAVHLPGHKPAWFALANRLGAPAQLLVKLHGDAATELGALAPGAAVEVSEPIGRGFPLDPTDRRPLVVLATGSGLSGVRALIDAEVEAGLPRPVHLLYGVFTRDHRSFVDVLQGWAAAGVEVITVLTEPDGAWTGATGFVQQVAKTRGLVRADVTVVVCGFKELVDEARALWTAAGATPEQVLVNS